MMLKEAKYSFTLQRLPMFALSFSPSVRKLGTRQKNTCNRTIELPLFRIQIGTVPLPSTKLQMHSTLFPCLLGPFCFRTSKRYRNTFHNTRKTSLGSDRVGLRATFQLHSENFSLENREQRVNMRLFASKRSVRAVFDTSREVV